MSDVFSLEKSFKPHRHVVLEYLFGEPSSFSYLIGNTKPLYVDMSACTDQPVRCLFLGSGDLRNVLHLIVTSPTVREWEFDLVDINPCVVARNLLLLRVLDDETVPIDHIWAIWYDFLLEESVYSHLQKLIQQTVNGDLGIVCDTDRSLIIETLRAWLSLSTSNRDAEQACADRRHHLCDCFERVLNTTFDNYVKTSFKSIAKVLAEENTTTIDRAQSEVRQYMTDCTTGLLRDRNHINVTLLQASSGTYAGHYDMHPYQGYIPFENTEEQDDFHAVAIQSTSPLFTYCRRKFEAWIIAYRQSRRKVKWHLWCGDALNTAVFHMPLTESL